MGNFWRIVDKVIRDADVLLMLLDSRFIDKTRNEEIEEKVKSARKPLIYVFTKCDLVDKKTLEHLRKRFCPSVFVSAKEHFGTTLLRDQILIQARKAKIKEKTVKVGVLGYPNVGKSSLINSMSSKGSASTSILSGHTKGVQKIRADNTIMFLDTPGVIPYQEKDPVNHTMIGTVDFNKAKDPDLVVIRLMEEFPGAVESYFEVEVQDDKEEVLETIARKKLILKKGNVPDIERVSRMILKKWQNGEIKVI